MRSIYSMGLKHCLNQKRECNGFRVQGFGFKAISHCGSHQALWSLHLQSLPYTDIRMYKAINKYNICIYIHLELYSLRINS